jgi:hypothetical protein
LGPEYNKRISRPDQVTIEAERAKGIIILCRRYTVDNIPNGLREAIEIHDVNLEYA